MPALLQPAPSFEGLVIGEAEFEKQHVGTIEQNGSVIAVQQAPPLS